VEERSGGGGGGGEAGITCKERAKEDALYISRGRGKKEIAVDTLLKRVASERKRMEIAS